jgi:hypothetical protein
VQLGGLALVVLGVVILIDVRDCSDLSCLAGPIGILMIVWGLIALLSGLRGPAGLVFLIAAIVVTMLFAWVKFLAGIIVLLAIMGLTRVSKDRLAPYYRRRPKAAA